MGNLEIFLYIYVAGFLITLFIYGILSEPITIKEDFVPAMILSFLCPITILAFILGFIVSSILSTPDFINKKLELSENQKLISFIKFIKNTVYSIKYIIFYPAILGSKVRIKFTSKVM